MFELFWDVVEAVFLFTSNTFIFQTCCLKRGEILGCSDVAAKPPPGHQFAPKNK